MDTEINNASTEINTNNMLADVADTFDWQEIGFEDFICNPSSDYSLRVERMSKKMWWWAVYFKNNEIHTKKESVVPFGKDYCMGLCEGVFLGHSIGMQ